MVLDAGDSNMWTQQHNAYIYYYYNFFKLYISRNIYQKYIFKELYFNEVFNYPELM